MDSVRLATQEEFSQFIASSDLIRDSRVVTFGGKDFAVLRHCWEIDPVFYHPSSNIRRRAEFINHIETLLRFDGANEYYFNVPATDELYMENVKKWGAIPTSPSPEIRFKKVL
jgi:hypothetical protein